ncbi:MAG: carboxymuconolactone decarboxylase family protein [Vicinamibacterales bacterium]
MGAPARVPLGDGPALAALPSLEPPGSGRVPNYLRALAAKPAAAKALAGVVPAVLFTGTLPPATKLALAWRIAQLQESPYVAAHTDRWLRTLPQGAALAGRVQSGRTAELSASERLALRYAELLTTDIHGVDDQTFKAVRGEFNDAQVVELTITTAFFNYLTRVAEGLRLPVEPWVFDTTARPALPAAGAPAVARVALASDAEIQSAGALAAQLKSAGSVANSQRAMLRVPTMAAAWFQMFAGLNADAALPREMLLQISFAVSMANGCRYCTLHQVQGLRGLGVEMKKLVAMAKDDAALTAQERVAVTFARGLTRRASVPTDADYRALVAALGEKGALEAVLQASTFNFMNRFTDGLRLPSEDEAVRVYREVYGQDFARKR